jgi:hypothetical protein
MPSFCSPKGMDRHRGVRATNAARCCLLV